MLWWHDTGVTRSAYKKRKKHYSKKENILETNLKIEQTFVNNETTYCDGCGSKIRSKSEAYTKPHPFYEKSQIFCCMECRDNPEQGC